MSEAEKVVGILVSAYPNHPWGVRVDKGIIFIKYLGFRGNWGMMLKTREVDHDAAVLKKQVIFLAGEWLERAGLKRVGEGEEIFTVEGVPEKPTRNMVVDIEGHPLRTKSR